MFCSTRVPPRDYPAGARSQLQVFSVLCSLFSPPVISLHLSLAHVLFEISLAIMLKIIALLLMVWVSSTLQVCYLPNRHPCGDGDPEGVCPQIDSTRPAHCCPPGFVCVSNWLCQALADGHYARYGCSEQNAEPDCVSNTICGISMSIVLPYEATFES